MAMAALLQSTLDAWAAVSGGIDTVPVLVGWVGLDTGTLLVVLLVGILTAFIGGYWGLRTSHGRHPTEGNQSETDAIGTLKDRYVNGDIDAVEFEQRLETLYEDAENRTGDATKTADSTRDPPRDRAENGGTTTDRTAAGQSRPPKRRGCGPGRGSKRRSKNRGCR